MEIYNETVTDLLVDSRKRKPLEIRETINVSEVFDVCGLDAGKYILFEFCKFRTLVLEAFHIMNRNLTSISLSFRMKSFSLDIAPINRNWK